MRQTEKSAVSDEIIAKARSLGASLAGIASVDLLKKSPSHDIYTKIEWNKGVGSRDFAEGIQPGQIAWPPGAKSALVIALAHPEDDPQMDWWLDYEDDRKSRGDLILEKTLKDISQWAAKNFKLTPHELPYHLEKGGIFYKDAGVLAGFGSIGKNNLLITPEYGPRVRTWALLFDEELPPTGPVVYDPCNGCDQPCRRVCPRNSFRRVVYSPIELGMVTLPGNDGWYDRETCRLETQKNLDNKGPIEMDGHEEPIDAIKFCRLCEFACPVGK